MSMDQQSLLRWSIENARPGSILELGNQVKEGKRPDLNTKMLDVIMGKSNAVRMKECMEVIQGRWNDDDGVDIGSQVTLDDKLRAWDDLEMLIEDLDNANDLKFLKLWHPIIASLSDENDEVRMRACWVCGTAVQNNPRAQEAFLELDPLPLINALIVSTTSSASTRSKAMYCLSSTLKLCPAALKRFDELDGWKVLKTSLTDPSPVLRTKTAFLLSSLILQSTPVVESTPETPAVSTTFDSDLSLPTSSTTWTTNQFITALRSAGVISTLIDSLSKEIAAPTGANGDIVQIDDDFREKGVRVLVNIVSLTSSPSAGLSLDTLSLSENGLNKEEKVRIETIVKEIEEDKVDLDELGLARTEWNEFKAGIGMIV